MASEAYQLLVLAAVAAMVLEAAVLVRRFPSVGVWTTLAATIWSSFEAPPGVQVAGFSVYPTDAVAAVLAVAVLLRLPRPVAGYRPLAVLAALVVVAIARGAGAFGVETAFNSARPFIYFGIAAAFAAQLPAPDTWRSLRRGWRVAGLSLVVVALVFVLDNGLGTYAVGGDRALTAFQALVVAQSALLLLAASTSHGDRLLALTLLAVVLISQQRTVWAAATAMIAVLVLASGRLGDRRSARAVRLAVLAGLAAVVSLAVLGPTELRESTQTAVTTASPTSGTFGWRIEGWVDLIDQFTDRDGIDQAVGQPSGAGFTRQVAAREVGVSPHNMYLTVLLALGVVGLLAYGAVFGRALQGARANVGLTALLWGLAVFGIGYQLTAAGGLVVGVALASRDAVEATGSGSTRRSGKRRPKPRADTPEIASKRRAKW